MRHGTFGSARRGVRGALLLAVVLATALPAQQRGGPPARGAREAALAPGDGIRMRIFREPELSGEFMVDERGIVVIPKVGEMQVNGIPADSIRGAIVAELRKFITSSAIEVMPYRRVAVTGSVTRPGLYPMDPSMTVADALILAGGPATDAKARQVEIRVAGASAGERLSMEARVWETAAGGTSQLFVPRQRWLRRNGFFLFSLGLPSVLSTIALIRSFR
jgi:polysaccharide export outer membrane protein